jgi:methionine synthase II (cobalamin-independent)
MVDAYPLCWPADYPRAVHKKTSRFKTSLARSRDFVKDEIRRIEGRDPVISTNVPLKNDGDLRADWSRYRIDDPGVAVYFIRNKQQVCLCCDTFSHVQNNLHAVGRTIEALRQIDRDGVSDFLNRTFSGFKGLPEFTSAETDLWLILGLNVKPASVDAVHSAYKQRAKIVHPDIPGGSQASFQLLQEAYNKALTFYNQPL